MSRGLSAPHGLRPIPPEDICGPFARGGDTKGVPPHLRRLDIATGQAGRLSPVSVKWRGKKAAAAVITVACASAWE